jgi:CubicO group peptidase (beta-lactamase class C family)
MQVSTKKNRIIARFLIIVSTTIPIQAIAGTSLSDLTLPPELFLPEFALPHVTLPTAAEPLLIRTDLDAFSFDDFSYEYNGKTKTIKDYIREAKVDNLLILKEGTIVFEYNRFPSTQWSKHQGWSISKQILSALIGIAIEEGAIDSIEDPMDKYDNRLTQNGYAGVSFRQALQMSSGIQYDEPVDRYNLFMDVISDYSTNGVIGSNLIEKTTDPELVNGYAPDSRWEYASINSQALVMALTSAINRPYNEYLYEKLLNPLGVSSETNILVDGDQNEFTFCCTYATSRTYAAFGQMYSNGGFYNGQQIVPQEWVRLSTTFDDPTSWTPEEGVLLEGSDGITPFGFAYHWWPLVGERQDFSALGVYGQSIHVLPKQETVIVRLSSDFKSPDSHRLESVTFNRAIADYID